MKVIELPKEIEEQLPKSIKSIRKFWKENYFDKERRCD